MDQSGMGCSDSLPAIAKSLSRQFANCFYSFLLLASWQLCASARAVITTPDGAYSLVTAHSSIDGINCITADYTEEEPLQVTDNSSDWPDNPEQDLSVWVGKATIPTRTDTRPLHFADSRFEAVTLHLLRTVPVFLRPTQCFYFLPGQIRERAPPSLT